MHELGIIFNIIEQVEKVAVENKVKLVGCVSLEIGEVSTIVPDYFRDCWKWAVERTDHMKGCKLEIITIEAITYCQDCEQTFSTVKFGKKCPHCGSEKTYLLTGKDVMIKQIEVAEYEEESPV